MQRRKFLHEYLQMWDRMCTFARNKKLLSLNNGKSIKGKDMSKESLAKDYAKEVADCLIENALEAAYLKGFEDGVESVKNPPVIVVEDDVEYVDLGLPSGTLWATELQFNKLSTMLSYTEARKYNIPTEEQLSEFIKNTMMLKSSIFQGNRLLDSIEFIGPNGNKVNYLICGSKEESNEKTLRIWSKGNEILEKNLALSFRACIDGNDFFKVKVHMFTGYHFPLALVKNPD